MPLLQHLCRSAVQALSGIHAARLQPRETFNDTHQITSALDIIDGQQEGINVAVLFSMLLKQLVRRSSRRTPSQRLGNARTHHTGGIERCREVIIRQLIMSCLTQTPPNLRSVETFLVLYYVWFCTCFLLNWFRLRIEVSVSPYYVHHILPRESWDFHLLSWLKPMLLVSGSSIQTHPVRSAIAASVLFS